MDLKAYRIKSLWGLAVLIAGMIICAVSMKEPIFFFTGLALSMIGWLFFSNYHTKIAIHKLKEITNEYVDSLKK